MNPGAGDVEGPGQDEGKGETNRNQDDKDLLDPRWRSKDGQNRAADLDQARCDDAIGQRDAVNPPVFEFPKKTAHVSLL